MDLKKKLEQHGNKVKKLLSLTCFWKPTIPICIDTIHLRLYCNSTIDLCNPHTLSTPSILTFDGHITFHVNNNNKSNNNISNQSIGSQIETLRLMHFTEQYDSKLLNNKQIIESLNLQNSLRNLTIYGEVYWNSCYIYLVNPIEKLILQKEYYYNLERVNILIAIYNQYANTIHDIFQMLQRNIQLLKHQFKQLNIGFRIHLTTLTKYHLLTWNPKIDKKFLNEQYRICRNNINCNVQSTKEEFEQVKNQWSVN